MNLFKIIFFGSIFLYFSIPAHSSEIDSLTDRFDPTLTDSTEKINTITNLYFDMAISKANSGNSCNPNKLRSAVHSIMGGHFKGKLRGYLLSKGDLDRRKGKIYDSVYQDFGAFESWGLKGISYFTNTMGATIKMGDYIVGSDKFAHFFNQGMRYYKKHYKRGISVKKVVYQGLLSETRYYLGSMVTGVASYGDLSANFKGMIFWNELVGDGVDVVTLKKPTSPYVKCINSKWVKIKKLDWNKIFDASVDEAYNCSMFRNDHMVQEYKNSVVRLSNKFRKNLTCPLDPKLLLKFSKQFGPYKFFTINPRGNVNDDLVLSPWPASFK